ncbi:MAG: hypothetical protein HC892_23590 [Saprospiraceae bacterium]|nr:hypothetical protein [Saprospiraceae bacterium]
MSHDNIPCSPLLVNIADRSTGNNRKYFWDFGNGQTDTVSNPQPITYEAIGRDTTYIITLRVSNGCSAVTYTESVFVKAGPNPRFDLDKDLHCSGESVAFQRINANADDNNNYWFWEFGDGRTFTGKNAPPIIYETNRQDTFMVSLTVGNECDTTTFRRAVVVIPTNVTSFLNVDRTITCSGSEVRFINASGVPNAEFFFSDGTSLRGDTIFYEFISSKDTVFRVTMRVFGCGYGDTTLMIRVLPMPILTASIPDVACSGERVPIIVRTDVADVRIMYGDGDSTQLRSSRHIYTTSGYFLFRRQLPLPVVV